MTTRDVLEQLSPSEMLRFPRSTGVVVRAVDRRDLPWLLAMTAPARALLGGRGPAAIVELEGRRAGYIGPKPLSGDLEFFLQPWARGCGAESAALREFLVKHRHNDRERKFVINRSDAPSLRALLRTLRCLRWVERCDYRVIEGRTATTVWVKAMPPRERAAG